MKESMKESFEEKVGMGSLFVKVGSIYDPPLKVTVPTLAEASRICRTYIEEENLGSSEWVGGGVFLEETGERLAVVSYNGRVWFSTKGEQ